MTVQAARMVFPYCYTICRAKETAVQSICVLKQWCWKGPAAVLRYLCTKIHVMLCKAMEQKGC